ncbi:MAG: hypothetical protein K1X81_01910 [Bacteroidia bacterium]|nr:hypothetical protein [Bacteroidia bacterium]
MSENTYQWPHGPVDEISAEYDSEISVTIKNSRTQLTIGEMEDDSTLNLNVNEHVPVGAQLLIKVSASETSSLTPGTGMQGNALTITADKSYTALYEYDGSKFLHVSDKQLN